MTIGEKIKVLREEHGYTQEELGKLLGVQKAAINKYETGRVENIKKDTITKLCDIFGVDQNYLMDDSNNKKSALTKVLDFLGIEEVTERDTEICNLVELLKSLSDDNFHKVVEYAEFISHKEK